jgi:hypothetical protein
MKITAKKRLMLAALSVFILCGNCAPAQEPIDEREKDVTTLLTFPSSHGMFNLPPDQRQIFDRIVAHPQDYLKVIEKIATADLPNREWDRLTRAAYILKMMNIPAAYEVLGNLFVKLASQRDEEKDPKHQERAKLLSWVLLSNLGTHPHGPTVSLILKDLPAEHPTRRGPYFSYLQKSCRGNEEVRKKLEAWRSDMSSGLQDDPNLVQTLEIISQQK